MSTIITKNLFPIDRPNKNGRIYSQSCAEQIVKSFHEGEYTLLGELDTPAAPVATGINIDRVSHEVEDVFVEDNNLMASVKVMKTPLGNILKELVGAGVEVGLAMRGKGEVHETGYINEYELITVDVVMDSSAPNKIDLVDQIDQIMDSMEKDGLL